MASESNECENLACILQDTNAGPRCLSLQDLRHITDDFSDNRVLGRGGFGVVYKGVLNNGEVVAVKRIVYTPALKEGQFKNEVYRLMVVKHPNIVRFLGYCCETRHLCVKHEGKLCFAEMTERLVCLEYVPNKSLQNHISDESCGLGWHERYKIIKGVCHGLHYLHEESPQNTPIIHSDLKPANILLTNEMEPKITDFGQSRLFGEQQSRTYTLSLVGTLGYMAREYLDHGIITKKTDIFSLGVIIIEIITGHREYPQSTGKSTQNFVEMVLGKWKKRLKDLGCTSLEEDCQQIKTCIEIGLRCVLMNAVQRPTTEEIVNILGDSTNLQVINEKRSPAEQVDPRALIEAESSKQNVKNIQSNSSTANEPPPHVFPSRGFRICAGCENPIVHGRFLSCMNPVWHAQCFRCFSCSKPILRHWVRPFKPISEYKFAMHDDHLYHRSCCNEFFHPTYDVCNNFIPTKRDSLVEYRAHPFWMHEYYLSHEDDTSRCWRWEQMEDDHDDGVADGSISDAVVAELEASMYGLQIIKNGDLEELRELGSGTSGTVYFGKWRGTDVAIKRIKKSYFAGGSSEQEKLTNEFWGEAKILSKLHHPNVVDFYGVVPDGTGGTLATVTEFMASGSLRNVLSREDRMLDRRRRLTIAMDAAFGMEYLHSKSIVHFDLKCDNLLVNLKDPQRPICKVGDFGLSRIKRKTLVSGGVRGTLPWMAPELLNGSSSKVSEKIDVFSFGIVLWEILTGELPYKNMHYGAIIGGIVNDTLRPPIPEKCDPDWRKLMEQCWSTSPDVRPSFTEVTERLRAMLPGTSASVGRTGSGE